jgi:Domain of Unknown Function (DUF326)
MRRNLFVAAALAVALVGGSRGTAADEPKHVHGQAEMEKCLKECARCAKECESCFNHCTMLVSEGKKEHLRTLRTCIDCGEFCAAAGKMIARHGALMNIMCDACAKACDVCGAECNKHAHDEHMKRCADACKDCAKACRDMTKATGGTVTTTRAVDE